METSGTANRQMPIPQGHLVLKLTIYSILKRGENISGYSLFPHFQRTAIGHSSCSEEIPLLSADILESTSNFLGGTEPVQILLMAPPSVFC